jgi:hypothetical protein
LIVLGKFYEAGLSGCYAVHLTSALSVPGYFMKRQQIFHINFFDLPFPDRGNAGIEPAGSHADILASSYIFVRSFERKEPFRNSSRLSALS